MVPSADNVPVPNVVGDEGFTGKEVYLFKNYFCKHMCENEWDNFYEDQIFLNDEFRTDARAIFNEETHKDFWKNLRFRCRLSKDVQVSYYFFGESGLIEKRGKVRLYQCVLENV